MKRGLDVVLALFGLFATLPFLPLVVVLLKVESSGPVIFTQLRIGMNERPFTCHKLRTMKVGTPEAPTHQVPSAATTRIGGFLRATKIDEIPQLWDVLVGNMSMVGPRPCLPSQEALIKERRERGVFLVRPGITGLAQVQGIDMSDPERLAEVDVQYVRRSSVGLDFRLILATVLGRGRGDRLFSER